MTLYEHQQSGADYLAQRARGYLGDTPGLGKTYTIAEALRRRRDVGTLVVCPAIVRSHWQRVLQEFEILDCAVESYEGIVNGGVALRERYVSTLQNLVLDEVHYLKNAGAQRTQLLLGKLGYARRMRTVYAASGTPISKHPAELWTILSTLFPEVAVKHGLRTYDEFVARFCTVEPRFIRGQWVEKIAPELKNEIEYKQIIKKIMLRRTLDDVGLDVPPLDWQVVRLDTADDDMWSGWSETAAEIRASIGDGGLDSIAADPHVARMRRRLGELKAPLAVEMLQQQLDGTDEKVVVFAHHRSVLGQLREGLEQFGVAYIDGDTPPRERERAIGRFQSLANVRVFLGQTIACQTGITLTAARRCVLVEPDWTAVVNHQAGHRIARIGQKAERCIAQMIALADTLDEAIVGQNVRETKLVGEIERKAA